MKVWSITVTAALAISLVVTGCSIDDLFDPSALLGIDDGAGAGAKESLKVEATTEARIELATGASLTVPKGAVEHSVMIGVERPADSKAVELVETLKSVKAVASAPYVLTPHGTQFQKDVRLEIPVSKSKDRALVVAWLKDENDREWKFLQDAVIEDDVAVVTLKHFSVVVVLDRARAGLDMETPSDTDDAGASADAGEEDAGSALDAGDDDAATATDSPDAGSVRDAGVNGADASVPARVDAGEPSTTQDAATTVDAGAGQANDASTSSGVDSGSQQTDAALDPDASVPAQDAAQLADAEVATDADVDADTGPYDACTPLPCFAACGTMPDGCGGYMECGDCSGDGGVCGFYQPNVCGFPIQ